VIAGQILFWVIVVYAILLAHWAAREAAKNRGELSRNEGETALAGYANLPESKAGPAADSALRAADAVVDETCCHILSVVRASHVTVNRDLLERLEGLARANPGILAPPASARKARDIAGRVGDWPVVENKGMWFVLENQGHPASDGFFRVSVVDIAAGRLVGKIADSTGNAPASTPARGTQDAPQQGGGDAEKPRSSP
jgi:hypothetical protein